jgi:hypothetical protein
VSELLETLVKRLLTVLVVVTTLCAGVLLFLSTKTYRRLPPADLKFDKKWTLRIPTAALKRDEQVKDELDICEAIGSLRHF